jgi:hypothetical protein
MSPRALFWAASRSEISAFISGMRACENWLKEYSAQPTPSNTRTTNPVPPPKPDASILTPCRLTDQRRQASSTASTDAYG